jgi:hypothetical protein
MSANPTEPPAAPASSAQPATDASSTAEAKAAALPEEVEVWWGVYSGWTMMRSFAVCVLLTGLIGWASWYYVPEGWVKITVVGTSSIVWLVQMTRWARHVFGNNYRLTTRHLWVLYGVRQTALVAVELARVKLVTVEQTWLERRLGVGSISVVPEEGGAALVLRGVRQPFHAADLIRTTVKAARAGDS